jgi:electron transport complex protein RnfD
MRDVLIALLPAVAASIIFFGWRAILLQVVAIFSAVLAEYCCQKIMRRKITIGDLSAVVTGLLLALCVSAAMPWWAVSLGSIFAIVVAKMLFGGLGFNIFNPALIGRAFLLASYPVFMTTWLKPFDTLTGATPLAVLKEHSGEIPGLLNLFFGSVGGSLGETSALAILLGAGYLFFRKVIDWRIPGVYLFTVVLFALLTGQAPLFHLLAGGLLYGAFFMATDYTTSPMSTKGKLIFGAGCGIVTMVIRLYGGYPEGVCYSILFMNMFVPLLDRIK